MTRHSKNSDQSLASNLFLAEGGVALPIVAALASIGIALKETAPEQSGLSASCAALEAIEGMWEGDPAPPPQSLVDSLLLADQPAPVESPTFPLAGNGRESTEVQVDVALDHATLSSVLEESAVEIQSRISALRA